VIEEQFCEEGEVLPEKFMIFSIDFPDCIPAVVVDFGARGRCAMLTSAFVICENILLT
jgi:hypothetical protein